MYTSDHTTCVVCGGEVCPFDIGEHDCEINKEGCQVLDESWTCSEKCWEKYCSLNPGKSAPSLEEFPFHERGRIRR